MGTLLRWMRARGWPATKLDVRLDRFEGDLADHLGAPSVIGVASATSGLELILSSLDLDPGDEVLLPAVTHYRLPQMITALGLKPIYADVREPGCDIDPDAAGRALGPRTRVLVATHLFGNPCDLGALSKLAAEKDLILIEDCAQSLGATWDGQKVGSWGDAAIFSFAPGKVLTCLTGGAVSCRDEALTEGIEGLLPPRGHRRREPLAPYLPGLARYALTTPLAFAATVYPVLLAAGLSGSGMVDRLVSDPAELPEGMEHHGARRERLPGLAAALGSAQLPETERRTAARREAAAVLDEELGGVEGLRLPARGEGSVVLHYNVMVEEAHQVPRLRRGLLLEGIDTQVCDMMVVAAQPALGGRPGLAPIAEGLVGRLVELPCNDQMGPEAAKRVGRTAARLVSRLR